MELGLGPALGDRLQHPAVGVADNPLGLARQGAEEGAPVRRLSRREGLSAPQSRLAGAVADRAEDVEGDPAGGDPPPGRIEGPDPKGQMVEE